MKPRIWYSLIQRRWVCASFKLSHWFYGASPKEAYDNWKAHNVGSA